MRDTAEMVTVIIDCNHLCHRAMYTMGTLSIDDIGTGVIYGFLRQIKTVCESLKTNKLLFCWDSTTNNRKLIDTRYKEKRKEKKDSLSTEEKEILKDGYRQFTTLRKKVLPELGFINQYIQTGYEADDLIAKIVRERNGPFIIVTNDEDMYQCLGDAAIFKLKDKNIYTKSMFEAEYQIPCTSWKDVKAIAGCSSDGVIGHKGVGEKTAIKYLLNTLKETTKAYKTIKGDDTIYQNNIKLVELPLPGTKLFKIKPDRLSAEKFISICGQYKFDSMLEYNQLESWKNIFKGIF